MSASPNARAFYGLRSAMVDRLLELRSSLDPSLARIDEASARSQIEAVLDDFGDFIATGDLPTHRAFLAAFMAKRATEEAGASAALSTLVAIGDTAVQVVGERMPTGPGEELALLVARVTAGAVRIVNELIADELSRRKALSHELRMGHRPAARPQAPVPATAPSPWVMVRGRADSRTDPAPGGPGFDDRRGEVTVRSPEEDGEPATELIPALTTLPGGPEEHAG